MKQTYQKPEILVEEIILESNLLANSYIDVDPNGSGNGAANGHRGSWGDLWD